MNSKIEAQKALKKKLGVTFTPNMNAEDMLAAWGRVPENVKATLPQTLKDSFTVASGAIMGLNTARQAYSTALATYQTVSKAIEAGVAVIAGQPQQPVILLASEAAKESEELASGLVDNLTTQLTEELLSVIS